MSKILDREPVFIMGVVQTAIALAVSFGLDLSGEQIAGLLAFTGAVLGFIVRKKVTPVV